MRENSSIPYFAVIAYSGYASIDYRVKNELRKSDALRFLQPPKHTSPTRFLGRQEWARISWPCPYHSISRFSFHSSRCRTKQYGFESWNVERTCTEAICTECRYSAPIRYTRDTVAIMYSVFALAPSQIRIGRMMNNFESIVSFVSIFVFASRPLFHLWNLREVFHEFRSTGLFVSSIAPSLRFFFRTLSLHLPFYIFIWVVSSSSFPVLFFLKE